MAPVWPRVLVWRVPFGVVAGAAHHDEAPRPELGAGEGHRRGTPPPEVGASTGANAGAMGRGCAVIMAGTSITGPTSYLRRAQGLLGCIGRPAPFQPPTGRHYCVLRVAQNLCLRFPGHKMAMEGDTSVKLAYLELARPPLHHPRYQSQTLHPLQHQHSHGHQHPKRVWQQTATNGPIKKR